MTKKKQTVTPVKKDVIPMAWDAMPLPELKFTKHPHAGHIKISEDIFVHDKKLGNHQANLHVIMTGEEKDWQYYFSSKDGQDLKNVTHYVILSKPE